MKQYLASFIGAAIVGLLLTICKANTPLRFVGMCAGGAIGAALYNKENQ